VKPLEPLGPPLDLGALLVSGKAADVEAALARAESAVSPGALHDAALGYARAAWALKEGRLEIARVGFEDADAAFSALGETEAAELARVEAAIARVRRGRRESALEARTLVEPLSTAGSSDEVRARATIALGTAYRVLGDASHAQTAFAKAVELTHDLPEVRSAALNSLGTLCVSLGAFGAAETLCEHAAELCRLRKDAIGEAIAMGQLGAAALGRGDLVGARKFLSRQEWLSSQVGDAFGRTRALVWLGEVALEAGRADDALDLATRALASANAVTPPLSTFVAYAERVLGRARLALGDASGKADIGRACDTFAAQKLPLGEALSARDLALAQQPIDRPAALRALAMLAGLGLPERVAEVLPLLDAPAELELAVAAPSGRRLEPLEARLVYEQPAALANVAQERSASRKNLSRLTVLALRPSGLWVGALVLPSSVLPAALLDDTTIACAAIGGFDGLLVVAWDAGATSELITQNLASMRDRAGAPLQVALALAPEARLVNPGFGGGLLPTLAGVHVWPLAEAARSAGAGGATIPGTGEPEAALRAALTGGGWRAS